MKIVQSVVFDGSEDSTLVNTFFQIEGWAGIDLRPDDDPQRKAFRRIRGNSATVTDLEVALGAALDAADQLELEAETKVCPFPEIPGRTKSVEEGWRSGLREIPRLIRREAEGLTHQLEEGLGVKLSPVHSGSPSPVM